MTEYPIQATASRTRTWGLGNPTPWGSTGLLVAGAAFAGTISAAGNTDDFDISEVSTAMCSVKVGSPTGTSSPTLSVFVDVKDVLGNYLQVLVLTPLTAAGVSFASVGVGTAAPYVLTDKARFRWTLTGTNPVFPGVSMAFAGR
jgi:hypothetical protein